MIMTYELLMLKIAYLKKDVHNLPYLNKFHPGT